MDIQPTNQQPISDDQELAKVLAGVNQQADDTTNEPAAQPEQGMDYETTGQLADEAQPEPAPPVMPEPQPTPVEPAQEPEMTQDATSAQSNLPALPADLEAVKMDALNELRPLVDKLDVSPEEKFDTYLLLLRSTDDRDLIAPAHEAAKTIEDEAKRAEALLNIIKEIDFLAHAN